MLIEEQVVCYPGAILCGCCLTEAGKKTLGFPVDASNAVNAAVRSLLPLALRHADLSDTYMMALKDP